MKTLTTSVAKYLFALPFAVFGILHFMNGPAMAESFAIPLPGNIFWVYLTGAALVAAAVSIIIGKQTRLALLLLALMLVIFVVALHIPSLVSGDQDAMSSLLKDAALAGAALLYANQFGSTEQPQA